MKPNILFICVDQQRWDCLGHNDRYPVKTPNLDKLAQEGIRFDRSYTTLPSCCPARQALLCGKRPESFGALCNYDQGIPMGHISVDAFSWARSLKQSGYNTGYIGVWHDSPTHTPLDFGFDKYIPNSEVCKASKKYNVQWPPFLVGILGGKNPIPLEDAPTHQQACIANRLIDEFADKTEPWLIRMNFAEPHLPCRPSEPFASMYDPEAVPKWDGFDDPFENKPYIQKQHVKNWQLENSTWDTFKEMVALYYGYISQVDDAIGKVLDHLKEKGLDENTVVIYTSDHGDMAGQRHMIDKHYVLYEEVTHTPLIIKYPEKVKANTRCDEFVINTLDLVPTLLEIAGCDVPDDLHAVSMMPYLLGKEHPNGRQNAMVTCNGQQFGLFFQRMVRDKRYKYIWNLTDVDELYDLEKDPCEITNLIYDENYTEILVQMRKKLYDELRAVDDFTLKSIWLPPQLLEGRKL